MQQTTYIRAQPLLAILAQRTALFDGAMGTMLQRSIHTEEADA